MNNKIGFIAKGQIFDIKTEISILLKKNEKLLFVSFSNENTNLEYLFKRSEIGVSSLNTQLRLFSDPQLYFNASTRIGNDFLDLSLNLWKDKVLKDHKNKHEVAELNCHIFKVDNIVQLTMKLDRNFLSSKGEDVVEKTIKNFLEFLSIESTTLVLRNKPLNSLALDHFKKASTGKFPEIIINSYNENKIVSYSEFDLSKGEDNAFKKGLRILANYKRIDLIISSSGNPIPNALLICHVENQISCNEYNYILKELKFGIVDSKFSVSGNFNLLLNKINLNFTLNGSLSLKNFTLSASTKDTIPLNNKYSFSLLSLLIGISPVSGIMFGMTGQISIIGKHKKNINVFGGFVITPVNIPLITSAVSSSDGRISLMDLVIEIADIDILGIEFLDNVAVGDFEFQIPDDKKNRINCWDKRPSKYADPSEITAFNKNMSEEFNAFMPEIFHLSDFNKIEITVVESTDKYSVEALTILTDTSKMRHYRVTKDGIVSLSCQIYSCNEKITIGEYEMPIGFFFCGTLEVFSVKVKALFNVSPSEFITAVVQISPISFQGIFELTKSNAPNYSGIEPVENSGLAGTLIDKNNDGPTVYFNVNIIQNEMELFVSARLMILNLFGFDAYVIKKENLVLVNICATMYGFEILLFLMASYEDFSSGKFAAKLKFDTNKFIEAMQAAQQVLRDFAKTKQECIDTAKNALLQAQENVTSLGNTLEYYNERVDELRGEISWWHPIDSCIALAKIAIYESLIISVKVAIAIAHSVLDMARKVLEGVDAITDFALSAIIQLINSITEILWLNSIEIAIQLDTCTQKVELNLELHVLGKDVPVGCKLDLKELNPSNLARYLSSSIVQGVVQKTKEMIGFGYIKNESFDMDEYPSLKEIQESLKENTQQFIELHEFQNSMEDFMINIHSSSLQCYGHLPIGWQKNVTEVDEIRLNLRLIKNHCTCFYDEEFVDNLAFSINYIKDQNRKLNSNLNLNPQEIKEYEDVLNTVEKLYQLKTTLNSNHDAGSLYSRIDELPEILNMHRNQKTNVNYQRKSKEDSDREFIRKLDDLHADIAVNETNSVMNNFNSNILKIINENLQN
ncbi:hypothetical protein [Acinetobacter sp. CFCC 10889]|uniref:hypothetical protein n=1 Tax=Acinetobacter sp. CFCC 10889 TaxID=1775557 RepID=UPI000DCF825C|nr:hypothetical protein [Acinetobacter sp. CFCC 10889]